MHPLPKEEKDIPRDYPIVDLGQDHEIKDTLTNERVAAKMIGSEWEFGTEASKARWHNVAKDTDYNFAPELDVDMKATDSNLHNAE